MERILELIDLEQLTNTVIAYLPNIIAAFLVMTLAYVFYRLTRIALKGLLGRWELQPPLIRMLVDAFYKYTILMLGLVTALGQLGVDITAAVTGLGVAGIAIGFAAQDAIANVIASLSIFIDKPFLVGDMIRVNEHYGSVSEITMRTTRIQTAQNSYIIIPNKTIVDSNVQNLSKYGDYRVDVPLGIAYKEDIAAARQALLDCVKGDPDVKTEPAPSVAVVNLGASSVDLSLRVWTGDAKLEPALLVRYIEKGKLALDRAGIQIPYHHLQLFIDGIEDSVVDKIQRVA